MPVEIREIIIKTEIASSGRTNSATVKDKDMQVLKKQVLEECKKIIAENNREKSHKR